MASLDVVRSALREASLKGKDGNLCDRAYAAVQRQVEGAGQRAGVLDALVITAETSLKVRWMTFS
jgi:hypothetical protein